MVAPSRASETVSVPMWHCRCTASRPRMSPRRGRSNVTTSLRNAGSSVKRDDGVVGRRGMRRHALVPVRAIHVAVVVHARSVAYGSGHRQQPRSHRRGHCHDARTSVASLAQVHDHHDVGVVAVADRLHRGRAGRSGVAAGAAADDRGARRPACGRTASDCRRWPSGRRRSARPWPRRRRSCGSSASTSWHGSGAFPHTRAR